MESFEDLEFELKSLTGSILLIGELEEEIMNLLSENKNLSETFYLNHNSKNGGEITNEDLSIDNNLNLKNLHKYFKDGVDNIYASFDEIKDYIPAFIRESLRITKKNIYISFENKSDYKKISKKYKRYKIKCDFYSFDDYNLAIIEANDLIVHFFKEHYYYFIDSVERLYNYVSENV